MKQIGFPFLIGLLFLQCLSSCAGDREKNSPWPDITRESKPWTRWWWMGSDVDEDNISTLMSEYADAGFGGVEITPIYGVKGREDHYIDFLSPEWMDMLKASVAEAKSHDMGVDMNLGTGWPFGGPQITPAYAASRLIVQKYKLSGNKKLGEKILPKDRRQLELGIKLEALIGYPDKGEPKDLTEFVGEDGTLNWKPGSGSWELYAAFCGKTRQRVKRAAPGGEGYTMDHFSKAALDAYLARFDEAFGDYQGVRAFFNDSYEVYNASWSPGFFDEFLARRGYDLRFHLKDLVSDEENDEVARIKCDYRETMSELLLEHFTLPWTQWINRHGAVSRNQAHGSPGNLIDLYAAVDIPECEIFGHRTFDIPGLPPNEDDSRNVEPNPMMLKLATSAAHVTGKPKISNETFTWLGEHFRVALSQCKPEVEGAFLAGINHVFYHGTCYSPTDAAWPGWLFYASVDFAPSNSFWPHIGGLNSYIARCQAILQSGKPDNEVLVYWPVFDLWQNPKGLEMQLTVHNIMEWLNYPGIRQMADGGYSYDFISDALLQQVSAGQGILESAGGKAEYKALVIPACRLIPLETLEKARSLAEGGATVVFEAMPGDVPGLRDLEQRRESFRSLIDGLEFSDAGEGIREFKTGKGRILLCGDLDRALEYAGIPGEKIGETGLQFTRRSIDDGKYYYLVNHTSDPIDAMVPLNARAESVMILDPQDGRTGRGRMENSSEGIRVRVQLQSGESVFLRTSVSGSEGMKDWTYEKKRLAPVELTGTWDLAFTSGGPELPASRKLEELQPWTGLGDSAMLNFSGTAEYTLHFTKPEVQADKFILDLGKVYYSARVTLNGHDLGILWSVPFNTDVSKYLKEGENTLTVEVANLMANRIRYMDRQGIPWRIFHEINFVNIDYRPFDAAGWEVMKSGLEGPVRLIPVLTTAGTAEESTLP